MFSSKDLLLHSGYSKMDIHIVEDNTSQRVLYSKVAHLAELSSASFSCPQEYLSSMSREGYCKPKVILSDLEMPGMNGYELMRAVRKVNPEQRFIIISGTPALEGAEQSACLYFCKPVAVADLQSSFAALLQCENSGPFAKCICGKSCILDDRAKFGIRGWHCPRMGH